MFAASNIEFSGLRSLKLTSPGQVLPSREAALNGIAV